MDKQEAQETMIRILEYNGYGCGDEDVDFQQCMETDPDFNPKDHIWQAYLDMAEYVGLDTKNYSDK